MKFEAYEDIEVNDDFTVFGFISTGENGDIPKRVVFTKTKWNKVYSLSFGDVNEDDEIDYYSISNNGDRNKILVTIFNIAGDYTKRFPEHWISFTGSTTQRTRLYRMALGLHLEELSDIFKIYAYVDGKVVPFVKNMKINAFLIKRKKL